MTDPFAPSPGPRLKPVDVAGFPKPLDLVEREGGRYALTVGRADDNDLPLGGDAFPSVSAHHARFELREGKLWVVDLDSRNGVLVGGRRIEGEARLNEGDQVRLGSVGPRLLVVGGRGLTDTVFVKSEDVKRGSDAGVEELVKRGARRNFYRIAILTAVLIMAIAWLANDTANKRGADYDKQLKEAAEQIAALEARDHEREIAADEERKRRAKHITELETSLTARTTELEKTLTERSNEEALLLGRIDSMELRGASRESVDRVVSELSTTRKELNDTRTELEDARKRVDMLDPVNLRQARLSGVAEVRRSIVLIENRVRMLETESGAYMHLSEFGPRATPNFEGRGEEFSLESTGSGFCVSPDGWILTNAHVIEVPESRALRSLAETEGLEQIHDLSVVFSGDSVRHLARIESVGGAGVDLALIKIEPFEGIPALDGLDTGVAPPKAGSDIYLFGFPLGHLAVQEGETVIASTFRGILSRNVGGQMQVDAGVHPGNSGGPITDARGRVVGIVVSVQALPDRTAVYTIGYGIPIANAAALWPPTNATGGAEASPAAPVPAVGDGDEAIPPADALPEDKTGDGSK